MGFISGPTRFLHRLLIGKKTGFNLHKLALVFTCTDILIMALNLLPTVFYNNQYFENTLMNVLNTCNIHRVFF